MSKIPTVTAENITLDNVLNPSTTKDILACYCQLKGLKKSGKKEELVARLVEALKGAAVKEEGDKEGDKEVKKEPVKKVAKKEINNTDVIEKIKSEIPVVKVRKNIFNNFEHQETRLVFDSDKFVYGVQNPDGSVGQLTDDDIENCNKFRFRFIVPKNLNVNKGLDSILVDGLDGDLDDDIKEDVEDLCDEEEDVGDEPCDDEN